MQRGRSLTSQPATMVYGSLQIRPDQQGVLSVHWETLFIATVLVTISSIAAWAVAVSLMLWIASSPPSLWSYSNGEK